MSLVPTASSPRLGSEKWGIGPTAVVLKQTGPTTIGILASHTWSVAGDPDRLPVSSTFLQPFLSYSIGMGQTLGLNSESTYDWTANQWTVPINATYTKVFHVGMQAMSFIIGGRAYVARPEGGPDLGARAGLTFLFPTEP
jgi:hypothetical protein